MDNNSIALNVRKLRDELSLTQAEMADMMGVSRTNYVSLESGKSLAISKNVMRLAKALDIDPSEILLGRGYRDRLAAELREGPDFEEIKKTLLEQHRMEMEEKERCIEQLTEMLNATKAAYNSSMEAIDSLKSQVAMLRERLSAAEEK